MALSLRQQGTCRFNGVLLFSPQQGENKRTTEGFLLPQRYCLLPSAYWGLGMRASLLRTSAIRMTAYCLLPTGDWLPVQRHAQELVAPVEQAIVHRGGLAGVDVVGDQIVER